MSWTDGSLRLSSHPGQRTNLQCFCIPASFQKEKGQQRTRWLDNITDSGDISLSKRWEIVKDRESWHTAVPGVTKRQTRLSDWTATTTSLPAARDTAHTMVFLKNVFEFTFFLTPFAFSCKGEPPGVLAELEDGCPVSWPGIPLPLWCETSLPHDHHCPEEDREGPCDNPSRCACFCVWTSCLWIWYLQRREAAAGPTCLDQSEDIVCANQSPLPRPSAC